MSPCGGPGKKRRFHNKNIRPKDPALRRFGEWPDDNRGFYNAFRQWLKDTGYSTSALNIYSVAARTAIGLLDKPYWVIDPQIDIERVWQHLQTRPLAPSTLADYHKGLRKFAEFICLRCRKPPTPKRIHWEYFTGSLPGWLQQDVRAFIHHLQRNWKPDHCLERSCETLGRLTRSLRWMAAHFPLKEISEVTPQVWYAYLDYRLESGILPKTTNHELGVLKHMVHFLRECERPVCERLLFVDYLATDKDLPKDLPVEHLRRLQAEIQAEAHHSHRDHARNGRMDLAWFLLMLHTGLRTCEVRALRLADIDWQRRRLRIEQAKGRQDRIVYLSPATVAALEDYLAVRGPAQALPEALFIYRHKPLSPSYCGQRLRTYGRRLGLQANPHRLRHSCATLLLNAGAPILTVQTLLGHKWVDTTLGYARLYDGTVAAEYYAAMEAIEMRLALPEDRLAAPPNIGRLLAIVDSLRDITLSETQTEKIRQLRAGILALAGQQFTIQNVNVLVEEERASVYHKPIQTEVMG